MTSAINFLLLSLLLVLVACGSDSTSSNGDSNEAEDPAEEAAAAIDGQKIFRTYCITCHGIDGKLELNGAKDLGLSEMSLDEKILHITNGKGLMTPFKGILTDEEIKAVAEYTSTFIPEG